jgi:hypothetical protein
MDNLKSNKILSIGLFCLIGLAVFCIWSLPAYSAEPTVTPVFIFIYGYGPLGEGDEITVHTPCGVLCGKTTVTVEGQYGQMAVYGDDNLSGVKDGADYRERLIVRINGREVVFPAGSEPSFGRDGETYRVDLF